MNSLTFHLRCSVKEKLQCQVLFHSLCNVFHTTWNSVSCLKAALPLTWCDQVLKSHLSIQNEH